ncbi:Dihydrodipicolinate synthase family protein RB7999 [Olavius algarvensis Delta 1 endosymbiont]|nr:Dihydrodipicolinate synthase family protein RB7999 [Olavius algarvensis Delta 1 endosymbiont]
MKIGEIPEYIRQKVKTGVVIPAMPLALKSDRSFDETHQRALARYYIDAGVGGLAVGVHSTQFKIREPEFGLFKPVLHLVSETINAYCKPESGILKVAGICGKTDQALEEADFAVQSGYHAGLLSLAAFGDDDIQTMIDHCEAIARVIPIFGFYLQPSVGGRILTYAFWRRFAEIENVLAIKIAPFNRYQTFDVVRAVCDAGREAEIALYTGNDDNIVLDLLTAYKIQSECGEKEVRITGGLLGHWAVWTKRVVGQLARIHELTENQLPVPPQMLTLAQEITDANAVIFDAANNYRGCIPGIHEVLRRQGLFQGNWCLDENENLSPGQAAEIERVYRSYPHLNDDDFVSENLARWLIE